MISECHLDINASYDLSKRSGCTLLRTLEVRYARSFLQDLKSLEPAAYQRIHEFVLIKFTQIQNLSELPELRPLGSSAIFYRFTLENYMIGIEITGQIVKFLRILPKANL